MPPSCFPSASSFRPRTILTAAALIVGVAIVLWVVWVSRRVLVWALVSRLGAPLRVDAGAVAGALAGDRARHLPHRRRLRHGQLLISLIAGVATTIVLYAMYLHLTEALYRTRTDDPFLTIACSRRALAADVP
jgi:hypothetical protein